MIEEPGVDASLAAAFTPLRPSRAVEIATGSYGLAADSAHRFETERDDTFLVGAGTDRFVLKVANPADDAALIDMQCRALVHVAVTDPGFPVPRVVPLPDGELLASTTGADGEPRLVRLLTFLPGRTLDYGTASGPQRLAVGEAIGRLSVALTGFDHPAADRELAWDLQHLGALRPHLALVADERERDDVAAELDRFDAVTALALPLVRHQVVHNDVNVDNVVVDDEGWISGILDFGDMVRTAVVADLAVAMAYAVDPDAVDPWAAPYDLATGFERARPLTDVEQGLLPHLVRARMAQRMLVNSWLAATNPHNAHHTLRANGHAIASLRRLAVAAPPPDIPGG